VYASAGISTAIETCGACPWEELAPLAAACDLILYDLKLIDDAQHRRYTGVSNDRILDNAARLAGRNVQIRVPLIPNVTDTEENLAGVFGFMKQAGLTDVALLPHNAAAAAKYEWFDLPYEITGEPQDPTRLAALLDLAREAGLDASLA